MKNATQYEKKVRKLLDKVKVSRPPAEANGDPIRAMLRAILEADATRAQAAQALQCLEEEFVDLNELRVAPSKDLAECFGRGFPGAREKGEIIVQVLNGIFDREYRITLEHLEKETKRELRRRLLDLGLSPYAAAWVTLQLFDGHAVPVDSLLVDCLKMEDYVPSDSDLADVQGFLERLVPHKNALGVHVGLREYAEQLLPAVTEYRRRLAAAAAEQAAEQAAVDAAEKAQAARVEQEKHQREQEKAARVAEKKKAARRKTAQTAAKAAKAAKSAKAAKAAPAKAPAKAARKTPRK